MTEVHPPKSIVVARWLWIGSALLSTVRTIITLADRAELRTQLWRVQPELSMSEVERAIDTEIMLGLLICAAIIWLYVTLANKMFRGRNWARVVLTVFGVGGVVLGVIGMLGVATGMIDLAVNLVDVVLSVVGLALNATAVVYMFLAPSTAYFRGSRAARPVPPVEFLR